MTHGARRPPLAWGFAALLAGCSGAEPHRVELGHGPLTAYGAAPAPLPSPRAWDAAGRPMADLPLAEWQVEPADLAEVEGDQLRPLREGEGRLRLRIGGVEASRPLELIWPDDLQILGAAHPQSLPAGRSLQLSALVVDQGRSLPAVPLRWSSTSPGVAAVRDGVVVGIRTGAATISVEGGGLRDQIELVVTPERERRHDRASLPVAM